MKQSQNGNILRRLLPEKLKQRLRNLHRKWVFKRAIRRFREDPKSHAVPSSGVLRDLIYGWGNKGFGAEDEYLSECVLCSLSSARTTLECGSGLSTVLIAVAAEKTGNRHIALESHAEWAAKVRHELEALGLGSLVEVVHAPLKSYGDFSWYDLANVLLPDEIDCVVCDGPPGSTIGGRFGLLPLLKDRLAAGAVILLDDAFRPKEAETAGRWAEEYGIVYEKKGSRKPYFACRLPPA
jgi:predicted O-methyltransferase YrrM